MYQREKHKLLNLGTAMDSSSMITCKNTIFLAIGKGKMWQWECADSCYCCCFDSEGGTGVTTWVWVGVDT